MPAGVKSGIVVVKETREVVSPEKNIQSKFMESIYAVSVYLWRGVQKKERKLIVGINPNSHPLHMRRRVYIIASQQMALNEPLPALGLRFTAGKWEAQHFLK